MAARQICGANMTPQIIKPDGSACLCEKIAAAGCGGRTVALKCFDDIRPSSPAVYRQCCVVCVLCVWVVYVMRAPFASRLRAALSPVCM